jgi:phage gpG-like protein
MGAPGGLFQITISVENEAVIDRVLQGYENRASDLRAAWPEVKRVFQQIVAKAFESEGASTGAPWPQLAKRTQQDRVRQGFPPAHPILQRTQKLMRALTVGEGAYVAMTPTSMRYQLSSEVGYFKFHQSTRPRTKLPRRAPVLLTADDRTALMHPIRLHITGRDVNAPRRQAAFV